MSKKYKDKLCVYCAQANSTSADHVFAREFFLPKCRASLPKVPACHKCNSEKATIEHYFTSLLPFGACHADALENLRTMVPNRLQKNSRLHRILAEQMSSTWSRVGLLVRPASTLPIDVGRLKRLFEFIARGLIWFHWRTLLTAEHFVEVLVLTRHGEEIFDRQLFHSNAARRVEVKLGNGAFSYRGAQGVGCPQLTVWHIWIYGGVRLSHDLGGVDAVSSRISVVTGPQSAKREAELEALYGIPLSNRYLTSLVSAKRD